MFIDIYNFFRMSMNSGTILGYFLQALPVSVIVGVVYFIIRYVVLKRKEDPIMWSSEILRIVFVCYLTGLISLVVLPANFWLHFYDGLFFGFRNEMSRTFRLGVVNLVPSFIKCINGEMSLGSWVKTMLAGNIAMFLPLGLFLSLFIKSCVRKKIAILSVAVPVCIEVGQLFFGRSFDIDDIICNFIGIIFGASLASVIGACNSKLRRTEKETTGKSE